MTCGLCAVSDIVSDKEEYYKNLLGNWQSSVDKTIEYTASRRVKKEIKK